MTYLEIINDIEQLTTNRKKDQNYYKIAACIQVLRHSKDINDAFMSQIDLKEPKGILIHLFGLLQNLFVSIDALYDISKATMSHKYSVNLNLNKTLHELKYIRNDIVGHPTHRTYRTGGFGFSLMSVKETSMTKLNYETHIYKRDKHSMVKKSIKTEELIDSFALESFNILQEISASISNRIVKNKVSSLIYEFIHGLNFARFEYQVLAEVKKIYQSNLNANENSHNRLLWRIDLLYVLDNWKEKNHEKDEMIKYMMLSQANKIYEMACYIEGIEPKYVKLNLPSMLDSFYRFIKQDNDRIDLLKYLKDLDHPYHDSDLDELIEDSQIDSKSRILLNWLKSQKNENKVFLIGNELEKFDKNK